MKNNYTGRFFYNADANPWGDGATEIVNKEETAAAATDDSATGDQGTEQQTENTGSDAPGETATTATATETNTKTEAAAVPAVVKDWRETVSNDDLFAHVKSKLDRATLLKAAGIEDDVIKAIEYKDATGDWTDYLRIKSTDYAKLSPQQLIEIELRKEFSDLDKEDFEAVLNDELAQYKLDREDYPENSEEARLGRIKLTRRTEAIRARLTEEQNALKAPEKQADTTAQDREVHREKVAVTVRNSDVVKNLTNSKLISYGAGEEAFNYEVKENADSLIDAAITAAAQQETLPTEAEISKMVKTLAYHLNPEAVEKALIDHGKIVGNRDVRKEMANTQAGAGYTSGEFKNMSDAELLANSGTIRQKSVDY